MTVIRWNRNRTAEVEALEDVEAVLELAQVDAREHDPAMVEMTHDNGAALAIGVGRPVSVVTFSRSPDPPYFVSVGEASGDADDPAVFYYGGHWTEFAARNGVPADVALMAMRTFFQTGARPANIAWEEE